MKILRIAAYIFAVIFLVGVFLQREDSLRAQGVAIEAALPVMEAETTYDATPAVPTIFDSEKEKPLFNVAFPALGPGDRVTVVFNVKGPDSPDAVVMTFAMPTTETLTSIYMEQYRQARIGLDQVMKALDADPDSVIDTAIYQQNVVGERAALKRVAEMIRPILIGRGVNGVIRAKVKLKSKE